MSDPYAAWLANTAERIAKERGMKITIMDSGNDANTAAQQFENAVLLKPDVIIYQILAEGDIAGQIAMANAEDIPVILVNRVYAAQPDITYTVRCNDYDTGSIIGAFAAERLPQNAKVIIFNGMKGSVAAADRRQGFQDKLIDARPDIEVIEEDWANYNKDEAMRMMEDWLLIHDKIDGVISANDNMSLGAIEAFKTSNRDFSEVQFFGIDGLADGCTSIERGELTGSVLQDADVIATKAIDLAEELISNPSRAIEMFIMDVSLISPDNVGIYIAKHRANGLIK